MKRFCACIKRLHLDGNIVRYFEPKNSFFLNFIRSQHAVKRSRKKKQIQSRRIVWNWYIKILFMLCFYIEIFNRLKDVKNKNWAHVIRCTSLQLSVCHSFFVARRLVFFLLLLRFVLLVFAVWIEIAMQLFFNWHSQKCCTSFDCIWVRSASSYNWEQNDGLSTNLQRCYVTLYVYWQFCGNMRFSWTDREKKMSRAINLHESWIFDCQDNFIEIILKQC